MAISVMMVLGLGAAASSAWRAKNSSTLHRIRQRLRDLENRYNTLIAPAKLRPLLTVS